MSSWVGFTDRLRRHGRTQDKTTRGYCDTAAQRIEDLEDKLSDRERRLDNILKRLRANKEDPYSGGWYDDCQAILRENGQ